MPNCYTPIAVLFLTVFVFVLFILPQSLRSEGLQWLVAPSKIPTRQRLNKYTPFLGTKATYDYRLRFDDLGEREEDVPSCGSDSDTCLHECSNVRDCLITVINGL